MHKKLDRKGFSIVELLIGIVVIAIVALSAAYAWHRHNHQHQAKATTSSSANTTTSQKTSSSSSTSATSAAQIVLGASWAPYQQGYGTAEPTEINNGGDPTGIVENITWKGWGSSEVTGTGTGTYVAPNDTVSQGVSAPVTVVAFDLGTCQGKQSYNAVEWYFPQYGGAFSSSTYRNTCTGKSVGN